MSRTLNVFLDRILIGTLTQNNEGKISFRYDPSWLIHPNRIPISLSLPLQDAKFNPKSCSGFFSGLLPEEELRTLAAKNLGVSPNNDFSLLERIGGDCAGAIVLMTQGESPPKPENNYRSLNDDDLSKTLIKLPSQPLLAGESDMRISLAGAQSKMAIHLIETTFSLPLNGAPSTHILKPGNPRFPNLVFNEAFCMTLARQIGLEAATTDIKTIRETPCLIVERYDRKKLTGVEIPQRLHQEDFCQALGIVSKLKYQKEGGPSLKNCFQLIRHHSDVPAIDLLRLFDAILFNYMIGNNDAHGKNFSLIYNWEANFDPTYFSTQPTLKIRLAPLYDLVSTAIYPELSKEMAMAIGGEYNPDKIALVHFDRIAEEAGLSKPAIRQRIATFSEKLLAAITRPRSDHSSTEIIKDLIAQRCKNILNNLR